MHSWLSLLSVSLLFGCQKQDTIDHLQELNSFCPVSSAADYYYQELSITLPTLDLEPSFATPLTMWVTPTEASLDWERITSAEMLLPTLQKVHRTYKERGAPFADGIQLAFDQNVSFDQVVEVLNAIYQSPFTDIWLVAKSGKPPQLPPPPNLNAYQKIKDIHH